MSFEELAMNEAPELHCLNCNAKLTLKEMAEGWCDSCGKRLPDSYVVQAKQLNRAKPDTTPMPSRQKQWAMIFIAVIGLLIVIAFAMRSI